MKTFSVLMLVLLFAVQESIAQFSDDFNDGNLTENPAWSGAINDFTVNAEKQLQLNAKSAGSSWISAPIAPPPREGIEWQLFLRQSFAPSGSNYGRYYLISDQPDLSLPLNGFFLQFGEAGSNDAVELFRQSGTELSAVCRGTATKLASPFSLRAKVIRYPDGLWELYIDYSGGTDFILEATGNDQADVGSGYTGLRCTYTITNANRFYLDDISVRVFSLPDTSPPYVRSLEVRSSNIVRVNFNEALDASSLYKENFFVTPSGGNATSLTLDDDGHGVNVYFHDSFANGVRSRIQITGVIDLSGNAMLPQEMAFLYFEELPVDFRDIIITEIYADPTPSQGLPEAEYVELFNRSSNPVNLTGWLLSDGTTVGLLDSALLLPSEHLLLAPSSSSSRYPTANVLTVSSFPSLNNSGDAVLLKTAQGTLMDSVKYSLDWYRDSEKQDGGWSLELIDVQNTCDDRSNWTASDAPEGGTPGLPNSVAASRPDNIGPELHSISVLDSAAIALLFTEKLSAVAPNSDQISINPPLMIKSIRLDETLTRILISFDQEISSGVEYAIEVSAVYDCPGNMIKEDQGHGSFLLPEKGKPFDVVINEVLFNPRPTGVDFVELFNRSDKTIDLKHWSIRNTASRAVAISRENLLLRGGEYCVLTPNATVLKGEYVAGLEETFRDLELPALNDEEGSVVLIRDDGVVIDSAFYSSDMHSPFVKDDEGISLERISLRDGNAVSNWTSASSTAGFATPGYRNSTARNDPTISSHEVVVYPEIIHSYAVSRDFTQIRYRFDKPGCLANVRIYDHQGRSIRQIASNELLGTEGFFRWDGDRDNGTVAASGYYLVWFEIFDAFGTVSTFRRRIAVY